MIERERRNIVLNKAKNAGDALASARLFNEVQNHICRSQPIDGNLKMLVALINNSLLIHPIKNIRKIRTFGSQKKISWIF